MEELVGSLATNAMQVLVDELNERIEMEVRGAYRAGFDYLYVGWPQRVKLVGPVDVLYYPSNRPDPSFPDEYRIDRYALHDISSDEFRSAVHG